MFMADETLRMVGRQRIAWDQFVSLDNLFTVLGLDPIPTPATATSTPRIPLCQTVRLPPQPRVVHMPAFTVIARGARPYMNLRRARKYCSIKHLPIIDSDPLSFA